jgi:hypothetical protein
MDKHKIARALGWFSIGLGAAELLAPRRLSRALGIYGHEKLVRGFGLREIAAGVGLLTQSRRAPWMWSRVAGDALDLGALGAAFPKSARRKALGAALASVAAVTALDIFNGMQLSRSTA